jgi:hypothetical protein
VQFGGCREKRIELTATRVSSIQILADIFDEEPKTPLKPQWI